MEERDKKKREEERELFLMRPTSLGWEIEERGTTKKTLGAGCAKPYWGISCWRGPSAIDRGVFPVFTGFLSTSGRDYSICIH